MDLKGDDLGANWDPPDIRAEHRRPGREMRATMVELAVESTTRRWRPISKARAGCRHLRRLIRKGTFCMTFVPVLRLGLQEQGRAADAERRRGLPAEPAGRPPIQRFAPGATRPRPAISSATPMTPSRCRPAFKIMNDPFVGSLTFTRIIRQIGRATMLNSTARASASASGRMMMMHAINREEIDEAFAGDIIALAGLKDTTTGTRSAIRTKPVVPETMTFPEPVIEIAIEGRKTKNDQEKMASGWPVWRRGSVLPRRDRPEKGQTIMKGMGELHLDIIVDR